MSYNSIIGITVLIILILIGVLAYMVRYTQRIERAAQNSINDVRDYYEKNKTKSTDTQRAVIKGQLAEQFYPLTDRCDYLPSDMRFLGMPIDYIIFDGYTDAKDDGGQIREIIFAEIKSGSSQLSRHQRQIRDAVIAGRVRWETINV
jgi:predicted Holliday junction resolvase-like endonuclease